MAEKRTRGDEIEDRIKRLRSKRKARLKGAKRLRKEGKLDEAAHYRRVATRALEDIRALRAEYHKRAWLRRKVTHHHRPVVGSKGTLTWVDGHQVATWIAKILFEARRDGVKFTVTSGIRTLATAQYLWNNASRLGLIHYVSVAYPCNSNHCGSVYPKGAVDLAPPWAFIAWLRKQHAKGRHTNLRSYHDTVGSRDDVHFSHTGH